MAAEYSNQAPTGPSGLVYRMTDHLGSTRLAMQGSSVLARYDYLPFGERIGSGINGRSSLYGSTGSMVISGQDQVVEQQFTAKERDAESGLDYFGARFFMAPVGRFLSPDAPFADQFVENPQSWNLYSYVRNNPLAVVDDGGRQARPVTVATKIEQAFKVIQSFDPATLLMSRGGFRSDAPRNQVLRGQSQFSYPNIQTGSGFALMHRAQVVTSMTDVNAYASGNAADSELSAMLLKVEPSDRVSLKSGRPEQVVGLAGSFSGKRTVHLQAFRHELNKFSDAGLVGLLSSAFRIPDAALRNVLLHEITMVQYDRKKRSCESGFSTCADQNEGLATSMFGIDWSNLREE